MILRQTVRRLTRVPHAELLCLPALALALTLPSLLYGRLISAQGLVFNYAHLSFAVRQIRMGEIPSWNPYADAGTPEIADPTIGFFYPFHIPPMTIFSPLAVLNAGTVLHLVIAGAGMYLYLGSVLVSRPGRVLGALIYMLSGYATTRIFAGDLPRVEIYAWAPLLLYLVEEILRGRQRVGAAMLGGLVIACQAFAGDPQTVIYSSLALVAYFGVRFADLRRRSPHVARSVRAPVLFGAMVLSASLFSAIQLLPSVELLAQSTRAANNPAFTFLGSIPPVGLATFFAPRMFGDELRGAWGEVFAPEFYFHASTFYVGFFTLGLIIIALLTRRTLWPVMFFALLGIGATWLALGRFGYLYRLVLYVPILRNLRDIENINCLIPLSASVLAAFGFDRLIEPGRTPEIWARALRILALAVAGAALLVELTFLVERPFSRLSPYGAAQWLHTIGESLVVMLIGLGISAGLLLWRSRVEVVPARLWVAAVAFVAADLLYFGFPIVNAGADVGPLDQGDLVTHILAQDRSLYRVYGLDPEGLRGMLHGVQESGGAAGFLLARYSEYTNFLQGYPIDLLTRPGGPHGVIFTGGLDSPLVALLNVKYVIAPPDVLRQSGLTDRSRVLAAAPRALLYQRTRVYPRVLDSYGYRVLSDRRAILQALDRRDYDPRQSLILEREPDLPHAFLPGPAPERPAQISVTAYGATRVVVDATFARAGFLLLNDLYYPEWAAYVDGRPTAIYRANYLFRAVVVPEGRHDVRFVYRDESLRWGAAVSALAGAGGLVVWMRDRRLRRRS